MYRSYHLLDPKKKNISPLIELTQLLRKKKNPTEKQTASNVVHIPIT